MWTLLACTGAAPVDQQPVLTVEDGYGGGPHPAGAAVHVWAAVDPHAELVTGWTGDTRLLGASSAEWNGPLTMPEHDAALAAVIEAASAPLDPRTYALAHGDRDVLVAAAAAPVGVVLFFHGAIYSVDQLRDAAARTITFHLVRRGYTVVAVESEAEAVSGTGGWNSALAANPDLDNVVTLVDALRADGTLPAGAPVFAWGMSSGGMFAHTVGAGLPAAGVVAYCAPGTPEANGATRAPTAWHLAANDRTFPDGADDARLFAATLATLGILNEVLVHPPTPLYDERFLRVSGVDAERSRRIARALRAAGAVDDDDRWLVAGSEVDVDGLDGVDGLDAAAQAGVTAEIEAMAADHELYDDHAARMADFLDAIRG